MSDNIQTYNQQTVDKVLSKFSENQIITYRPTDVLTGRKPHRSFESELYTTL